MTTTTNSTTRSGTSPTSPTSPTRQPRDAHASRVPCSLDDLARLPSEELESLYRGAGIGAGIPVLDGHPRGRMLAIRGTDGSRLAGVIRFVAAHAAFPWNGKSFGAHPTDDGTGINRVHLPLVRLDLFDFRTRIEPSVVDGKPCVYLDYAQPKNPWFIAKIRDEIREVAPGLWLGPAMWKTGPTTAAHVLWFAVDFNAQVK